MQARKRWHWIIIFVAILLTIYNILPTVFYYTKPLKQSVDEKRAQAVALSMARRVNDLQKDSQEWLKSFCKTIKVSPLSITSESSNPKQIQLEFATKEEAKKFRAIFPRSGSLIPFVPAQLLLSTQEMEPDSKKVIVERQIPILLPENNLSSFFAFSFKETDQKTSDLYKEVTFDRAAKLTVALGGASESAQMVRVLQENSDEARREELVYSMAHNISQFSSVFKENGLISDRFFSILLQEAGMDSKAAHGALIQAFDLERDKIKKERSLLLLEEKKAKEENSFTSRDSQEKSNLLDRKEKLLLSAEALLKKNEEKITAVQKPWDYSVVLNLLKKASAEHPERKLFVFDLGKTNPFFHQILIDFANEKILLHLHEDIVAYQKNHASFQKELFDQLIINEIARLTRQTDEKIGAIGNEFVVSLTTLANSKSFLMLKLQEIARLEIERIQNVILRDWHPKHPEFANQAFPIFDYPTYLKLPAQERALGLILFAPVFQSDATTTEMHPNSLYVIAKGLDRILQKYQKHPDSPEAKQFFQDFKNLEQLLKQNGFFGYPGTTLSSSSSLFNNDFVFERPDYYRTLLAATREQFHVYGTKKYALLEFSNVEQRILAENQIETAMHEDLLKWKDEYHAAQVSMNSAAKYDVPKPTKSILWNNFVLSMKKYFRGDERKILHWGLDLSGGKTVQIELRDRNNVIVNNDADLKQGINELYNRVNKMGVSEVNIRKVDPYIVLDFPGCQNLSASELVKASTMYFHVVNEKFSLGNKSLADTTNRFLQEVWNEAVVTNRKDSESINMIAWKHLYGDAQEGELPQPRSEAAKILYENGFRLASILKDPSHNTFNDSLSKIVRMRGEDFSEWQGQTHPLLIVFQNYAMEGSDLTNVHASYDPSKGNYLSFEVKNSRDLSDGSSSNPRENLYQWTSHFAKEKIAGTPLELMSKGRGWRMAVILNDFVISSPALESALRDSAMISGNFSQREVNNLVSDLKAGSLSFTPRILSEKNVSPELGKQERLQGILATCLSFFVVIAAMMGYYRFAGTVASVAVCFNLLIIWATLQNLQATLSLAGLAGIILTVAMAVDANVLVNERIREDLAVSGKLAPAIQSGYRRAFSAIFDSNITTIIAALILLHFDAGPIKGFAVTLIIGIVSSMFSALFATKTFFNKWVENPKNITLKMHHLIKSSGINFLKSGKYVFVIAIAIIAIGLTVLTQQKNSIFGMDFTGGYSLNVELQEKPGSDYRGLLENALQKAGASHLDFQIRELSPANNLRILVATTMEESGKPFAHLPLENNNKEIRYHYQNNPRIVWIVDALQKANLSLTEQSLSNIHTSWSSVSGQMSESMRNNALMGLVLAFIAILIYLTIRFEFKYAFSALICLFHDVGISLAAIALLHALGVEIQIDLNTVAAIMTIVGYSLNDTIIIFDRIREDSKVLRKLSLPEIVNHSLNITLSRTIITSGTTFLALLPLVIFGGSTLFSFALVMLIGVVFGTLSSIYIASPCMLLLQKYESKKLEKKAQQEESV